MPLRANPRFLYMKIPKNVIERLTQYHFIIEGLNAKEEYISSTHFAKRLGIDNSQVRKDLSYLGNFGKCRVGYKVAELKNSIETKLGFYKPHDAFIVGAGNLGAALAKYSAFKDYGLNILAMFDTDPSKIGTCINGKEVFDIGKLASLAARLRVNMVILTVPKEAADIMANYLAGAGIQYIWNFTPCVLNVPATVKVWNENLIGSFLQLTNGEEIKDKQDGN